MTRALLLSLCLLLAGCPHESSERDRAIQEQWRAKGVAARLERMKAEEEIRDRERAAFMAGHAPPIDEAQYGCPECSHCKEGR